MMAMRGIEDAAGHRVPGLKTVEPGRRLNALQDNVCVQCVGFWWTGW